MKALILELRSGEGGGDAKDLVLLQFSVYIKWCERNGLDVTLLEQRPGLIVAEVRGESAWECFRHEKGGIRWQRVPPTEKRGRVHTSTVTVAVLHLLEDEGFQLDDRELEWVATRGSGAGGQHRNKTSSAVILTHKPTKLVVRVENERSQHQNLRTAKAILSARLQERHQNALEATRNDQRKAQVGTGMRSDKIRTVAVQRDQVVDHKLGRRMQAERYLKGDLAGLVS